jgi:hypothetical protein
VRPVLIVMGLVLAQDPPQMILIPDDGAVEELAAASPIQRSADAFRCLRIALSPYPQMIP